MRRSEEKFASPEVHDRARQLAAAVRRARLARNLTQAGAAERSRMSTATWMKLEKGDVSVSFSSWLSALECLQLLETLSLGEPATLPAPAPRQRARPDPELAKKFDF